MILFADTETTGMALFRSPPDDPNQPRIVQLGAILCDDSRRVVAEMNFLVKPDGWTIPPEASAIHGITTEMCGAYGLRIPTIIRLFTQMAKRAKKFCAHNRPFDDLLLRSEMIRAQFGDDLATYLLLEGHCTMAQATPILTLPGRYGDFKWPSLKETYAHFFGREFDGAHDAMADVRACRDVYWAMNPPVATPAGTPTVEVE